MQTLCRADEEVPWVSHHWLHVDNVFNVLELHPLGYFWFGYGKVESVYVSFFGEAKEVRILVHHEACDGPSKIKFGKGLYLDLILGWFRAYQKVPAAVAQVNGPLVGMPRHEVLLV